MVPVLNVPETVAMARVADGVRMHMVYLKKVTDAMEDQGGGPSAEEKFYDAIDWDLGKPEKRRGRKN